MENKIGYLIECGHIPFMICYESGEEVLSHDLGVIFHCDDWFIENAVNLEKKIKKIILAEMQKDLKRNELKKPKKWWDLSGWIEGKIPETTKIESDIKRMLSNKTFVGCCYCAGRKDDKGFILSPAISIGNQIFKKT